MIKEKTVKIKIHSKKYYNLENINKGDIIDIDVNDLPKESHVKITAVCDNCGKEKQTSYKDYIKMTKYDDKYYCVKCRDLKTSKSNMKKHGVKNVMQLQSVKESMYETNLKLYGNICSANSPEVKEKAKKTIIEKYGDLKTFYKHITEIKIQTCLKKYGEENVM